MSIKHKDREREREEKGEKKLKPEENTVAI